MTVHMPGSIKKILSFLQGWFYPKCDYYDTCPNIDENNCTCLNGGGSFCGKWRELEYIWEERL